GRDQVFVLAGDVEDLDLFQIHPGVVRKILQPRQDLRIAKQLLFHHAVTPFLSGGHGAARCALFYHTIAAGPRRSCIIIISRRGCPVNPPPAAQSTSSPLGASVRSMHPSSITYSMS